MNDMDATIPPPTDLSPQMTGPVKGMALLLGAHGGIGEAIATALACRGADLVLAARDRHRLEDTRDRLTGDRGSVRVAVLDVTDDDAVCDLVESLDGLSVAVNNFALAHRPAPLPAMDVAEFDNVIATALRATFVAMRAELQAMNSGASLVNIVSTAGLRGGARHVWLHRRQTWRDRTHTLCRSRHGRARGPGQRRGARPHRVRRAPAATCRRT